MRRSVAIVWHAVSVLLAACLYFFFVLPRWPEFAGDVSHTLGTALRIVTGLVVASTALPVLFTLRHTRRPEFGTPQLALTLRTSSIIGAVLAGVMIIGTAVAEIWVSLDDAGQWLFGCYGAAAAIAVLSAIAFHLAYVAELPPAPPKPIKAKKSAKSPEPAAVVPADEADEDDAPEEADAADAEVSDAGPAPEEQTDDADELELVEQAPRRGLRNKRPIKLSRDRD